MKKFIETLKESNIHLKLNNEDLEITYFSDDLPASLIEEIKDNKSKLIDYLKGNQSDNDFYNIKKAYLPDGYPLSSSQQRIWILSQFEGGSEAYHCSSMYAVRGQMDVSAAAKSFAEIISRYEILRTYFKLNEEH